MQIYKVGGAVRDRLLGLPVKDTDWVVVGATVEEMLKAGYRQVGKDFPVFLHPKTNEEYALARTERKSGKGYTGFSVHASPEVTLEEDLHRRDLTINAMAEAEDGSCIDPYGGEQDLSKRILRHVSPAFAEDPLRVLRVARFAARFSPLGFTVADETLTLMRQITDDGELDHLVPERVWQETSRALAEKKPGVYFSILKSCGALDALFPELDRLFGFDPKNNPESESLSAENDRGLHMLQVLGTAAGLSSSTPVRFAAVTHEIGIVPSGNTVSPGDSQEDEGVKRLQNLCARLRIPKDSANLARLVILWQNTCLKLLSGPHTGKAEYLMALLEGCDALRKPDRFSDFLLVCEAIFRHSTLVENDKPFTQGLLAMKGLELARSVDAKALAERGLDGPALGTALRQERIEALWPLFD